MNCEKKNNGGSCVNCALFMVSDNGGYCLKERKNHKSGYKLSKPIIKKHGGSR